MENKIAVKGVAIHGRNLKKFFEYYFVLFTNFDQIHSKKNNLPNPFMNEMIGVEQTMRLLDIQNEWYEFFQKRRKTHGYWIQKDKSNQNK